MEPRPETLITERVRARVAAERLDGGGDPALAERLVREASRRLVEAGLPLPAYDHVLKCSHAFNMLDARGAISVTQRVGYIGRVRNLARAVARLYVETGGYAGQAAPDA